jgi:outer membrane protein assembly factor BamA
VPLRLSVLLLALVVVATPVAAQSPGTAAPQTREDLIAAERAEKVAELWPERQSAIVDMANRLSERGFDEGLESGRGANGFQMVLGGMRSGQGLSGGVGYRRSDLARDQLAFRGTARGTTRGGYMFDAEVDFQGLRTERTFLQWYTRLEHSPEIDYFGLGNNTSNTNRTSYLFDDLSSDLNASLALTRTIRIGATGGYYNAHTAPSSESGVPPIHEAFPPESLPGFTEDTDYTRIGVFAYADSRDSPTGPRSGALAAVRYREYWDLGRKEFAFRQTEFELQQYVPYFNRGRVLALRGALVLSYPKGDNAVPIYLQPTIGGSDELRGYVSYRFRDYHALKLSVEHRWHAFSFLDMAVFADAGKVVPLKRDLEPTNLRYSGGLGFRVRLRSAIITRIDLAGSSEGFRMIWTFSDVFDLGNIRF